MHFLLLFFVFQPLYFNVEPLRVLMFVNKETTYLLTYLDWLLNASRRLSASAELLVLSITVVTCFQIHLTMDIDSGLSSCHFIWWDLTRVKFCSWNCDFSVFWVTILCKYRVYNSMERTWNQSPKQTVYDIRLYTKTPLPKITRS